MARVALQLIRTESLLLIVIIYLHGLNSAGNSGKAAVLSASLPDIQVVSPIYPAHTAAKAVETLVQTLKLLLEDENNTDEPSVLVGSSMGGFYGAWLAQRLRLQHLVMINPALQPWELLQQVVGRQYNQALDEHYYLSSEMVADTRQYAVEPSPEGVPTTLLLDKGDELIDYRIAEGIYQGIGDIHCFEGGSHTFDHMEEAVAIIRKIHDALVVK
ncbi:MAG: YqiA/YcfP family alpha/beta fold hydrolase [Candidatus Thiodiazotropha endolucinida]